MFLPIRIIIGQFCLILKLTIHDWLCELKLVLLLVPKRRNPISVDGIFEKTEERICRDEL